MQFYFMEYVRNLIYKCQFNNTGETFSLTESQIPICRRERKEDVVDSILCKESNKCLFYNAFRHVIHSATKNKK